MLSILIPTYNRTSFLIKNLNLLLEIIEKEHFQNEINIIVSDNCSTDSTWAELEKFRQTSKISIFIYHQEKNIGLKANALFTLNQSTSPYVMYLGDDDFISSEYLSECLHILKNDTQTSVIIPNYIPVSPEGKLVGPSRQPIGPTLLFKPGFESVLQNSWKGHQLSGLVLKRKDLFLDYERYKVDNIYLFIFFVAISGLKGNTYLITQNPVEVTQPTEKKDWGYGNDGLVNQIFDNYKKLPVTYYQRFKLEFMLLYHQWWRLYMYKEHGKIEFLKALLKITFAPNSTFLFSLSMPALLMLILVKLKLK